jgi:hypothetical protein
METLKEIVNGTSANLTHICNGKAYFKIETRHHVYQLEINCNDEEWNGVYIYPIFKTITLMRWIRKAIESNSDTFIMLR